MRKLAKHRSWRNHYERIFKVLIGNSLEGNRKLGILSHYGEVERKLDGSQRMRFSTISNF